MGGRKLQKRTALNPINCVNYASIARVIVDRVDTHYLTISSSFLLMINPLVIIFLTTVLSFGYLSWS